MEKLLKLLNFKSVSNQERLPEWHLIENGLVSRG